jgi:hypothetical protein
MLAGVDVEAAVFPGVENLHPFDGRGHRRLESELRPVKITWGGQAGRNSAI